MCYQEVQSQTTVSEVMQRVYERQLYRVIGNIAESRPEATFANEKVVQRKRME